MITAISKGIVGLGMMLALFTGECGAQVFKYDMTVEDLLRNCTGDITRPNCRSYTTGVVAMAFYREMVLCGYEENEAAKNQCFANMDEYFNKSGDLDAVIYKVLIKLQQSSENPADQLFPKSFLPNAPAAGAISVIVLLGVKDVGFQRMMRQHNRKQ